ncbi:histidinol phosphatase-like enzyme (inositol monophosphatase family) [Acinetobacter calcoaceticus]|uniref:Nus factor SuhB n=1 Tax=Acinetobacter calcoaceticus TaxID=471 RepID=A0A4V2QZB4_ACICA|nr:histidinol phosphatase-like enzyme (inositol monophosphatase family) [Acinetobacter calcoaceticus]
MEYATFLDAAHQAADRARIILNEHRQNFRFQHIHFETKDDESPVTEVDQFVENEIRKIIENIYPEHGILGEEFGAEKIQSEFVWVIDPIDGTKQFIAGLPVFGVLIALCHNGIPVLGIIEHPALNERWVGIKGHQSTLNGQPISTRDCTTLETALMSSSNTEPVLAEHLLGYQNIIAATKWRIYGVACYAYACLATGKIDLSIDSGGMREVDYCALVPVIEGAGGVISDWNGNPLTIHSGKTVVAAGTPALHQQAIALLRKFQAT